MEDDQQEYSQIILETDQDYREAVAALDEQMIAASLLADNIAVMADAINRYELENNLEIDAT